MKKPILGEVEHLILLAIHRLGDSAYAASIRDEVRARAGVELSRGTIYVTLDRLERQHLLQSRFGDPTPARGGKAKRFFRLTRGAREALARSRRALVRMWQDSEVATGTP